MTVIRPVRSEDVASIAGILNPIISDTTITFTPTPLSEADLLKALSENERQERPYLIADRDGSVVGYAKLGPFRSGAGYARTAEITVHVAPEWHGRGIGRALVEALVAQARATGVHSLIAGVSAENANAIKFHEKLGFAHVGLIPEAGYKFDRYIDLVLMQKFV
ncbi:GNAT family N-acetyltransferase [Litoreibacter arenae]|uniref:Phosphinothricin N-acetyltransferase, putative n=1 Tax=Litoreibacter arenae DSM 19593 TaxID=1123360 RepID=S9S4W2_9RHOB|nr:GNAT family N-acetyltransferase [Litoreibacter arenae]EPX81204.1 phosphinothricin N-acetyltransferase, putative [Litoreibacter arenae DSM 19593]